MERTLGEVELVEGCCCGAGRDCTENGRMTEVGRSAVAVLDSASACTVKMLCLMVGRVVGVVRSMS
jgi:hypothetical protein